jgi:hypothetical protein
MAYGERTKRSLNKIPSTCLLPKKRNETKRKKITRVSYMQNLKQKRQKVNPQMSHQGNTDNSRHKMRSTKNKLNLNPKLIFPDNFNQTRTQTKYSLLLKKRTLLLQWGNYAHGHLKKLPHSSAYLYVTIKNSCSSKVLFLQTDLPIC